MKDAFKIIDNILYQAVNGMSEVILNPGNSDINTDFADVKTIMQHKGMALMGIGRAKGENAAQRALEDAVDSPLLDKVSLNGAKGILIHFNIHPSSFIYLLLMMLWELLMIEWIQMQRLSLVQLQIVL